MISSLILAAVLVAPPDGPFVWHGKEKRVEKPTRYFRFDGMKAPVLIEDTRYQPRSFNDVDLVREFVKNPSAKGAFRLFEDVVRCADTNKYAGVTNSELAYLLRYAASHGHESALEFFDKDGNMFTGLEYDYVFAKYVNYWAWPLGSQPVGSPGYGLYDTNSISQYPASGQLKDLLGKYSLTAKWFHWKDGLELPFLEFTPRKCPTNEVPLVVYIPGSGEQGTNLVKQFNQRACLEKVVSPDFQKRHPCRFMIIALPDKANVNSGHGYPHMRDLRSELYNDMILAYARYSVSPKVDPRRIYLTGLGSGGTIANGMMLDHPGRFAAVVPVWHCPYTHLVHPRIPGNWRIYNEEGLIDSLKSPIPDAFTKNAISVGGDCSFQSVSPASTKNLNVWWDAVWSGDEMWEWLFSKTAPSGPREAF